MTIQAKGESSEPRRAVQYLRMSTEHQQYSIANQAAAIALYAAAHQIVIVRSYIDPGKSGLTIKQRPALRELMENVRSGHADFECILTYDVSRWGRFQDIDEAAHYEFLCRSAGINIHYCAEEFENDNSMLNSLVKSLKRIMAGEYSRELSAKVFAAHLRLAKMGFSQGGYAPYGLQRLLVDANGVPKQILPYNVRKAIHTDRVVLMPGVPEEIANVRRIFDLCTMRNKNAAEIASELNEAGIPSPSGRAWIGSTIMRFLRNAKYTGASVYARRSQTLKARLTTNQPGQWAIKKDAFEPIISPSQFEAAQAVLASRHPEYTNEEMLNALRQLLKEQGRLSWKVIKKARSIPSIYRYEKRFGGMFGAYAAIGYDPGYDYARLVKLKNRLKETEATLRKNLAEQLRASGVAVSEQGRRREILMLNRTLRVRFKAMYYRCRKKWHGCGWDVRISFKKGIDFFIVVCLKSGEQEIHAQYIIPKLSQLEGNYWYKDGNARVFLEAFRSDTLQPLVDSVAPSPIQVGPWTG